MSSETLSFSATWANSLEPYLPHTTPTQQRNRQSPVNSSQSQQQQPPPPNIRRSSSRPFTTLTYAQSLDSQLALAPGVRTLLSGPASKAMTHFLRSRHDAILVGVGTAVADDPGLNCRLESSSSSLTHGQQQQQHHPQPVIVDPGARWTVNEDSKVVQLAREGKGKGPWVLYAEGADVSSERRRVVEGVGGRYIPVPPSVVMKHGEEEEGERGGEARIRRASLAWESVLAELAEEGVESLMVEGGGRVINDLLELSNTGVDVVDSVIVTIAPVWLGSGGVTVSPNRPMDGQGKGLPGPRLGEVRWVQMGEDMVLCGKVAR
ncbi:2,5-diamino-6-(ribosylamino)-4(3H)-pyrimidinone 5'-phosphate reductase [Gnomoniopsis sp. IMI 355080]|nr:2,5-diamino-6-(ribosylamino)-4(3H)-pyrimidinone 5'-phosphate reductase [Gnomoniopsis sp. IMI 355080]